MLEASGDGQQNLDGIFSSLGLSGAAVEPSSEGKHNDDEGIAQNTDEEEQTR